MQQSELRLRDAIQTNSVAVGTYASEFGTANLPRIVKSAKADFLFLDVEHSGWSTDTLRLLLAVSKAAGLATVVRVARGQYQLCSLALDLGASGAMMAMIENEEEARALVAVTRYPPVGRRGCAFNASHDDFVVGNAEQKVTGINREVVSIAMIETPAGVENVGAIVGTPGVDALWVGHFDLTATMGMAGHFENPEFLGAVDRIVSAAEAQHKVVGIMAANVQEAEGYIRRGFRLIAFGGDAALYQQTLGAGVEAVRSLARSGVRKGLGSSDGQGGD